jgi:hypothetical protein
VFVDSPFRVLFYCQPFYHLQLPISP